MTYADLRGFLAGLDAMGELLRVDAEVDSSLEIAEITDRQSKLAGGKALLFTRVKGSRFAVATNLFGSETRMAAALGVASLGALTPFMEKLLARPEADGRDKRVETMKPAATKSLFHPAVFLCLLRIRAANDSERSV